MATLGPVPWIGVGAVATWAGLAAWLPDGLGWEVFFGMLGPLVAVLATWVVVARAAHANPARLTRVMLAAFGVKVLFFGVYVATLLGGTGLRPEPFVWSFTAYFVVLYGVEAALMRRLLVRVAFDAPAREI